MNNTFNKKIKNRIWLYLKDIFYDQRITDSDLVQNINYDCTDNQKRLLICYRANGYFTDMEKRLGRTVLYEIFKIINVFSELNYCIDLIDCNNNKPLELIKNKTYDVIFGFGENFYQTSKQQPSAVSILYMTENHPAFSLAEEKKRLDYFHKRRGKNAKIQRSGEFYKLYHFDIKYSYVIAMGELEPLKYQYPHPKTIYPTGIINPNFTHKEKDQASSRKHFLWLGSKGAIHKGLDILIDIFVNRDDITLHVGGLTKQEREEIDFPKRSNIIEYGHIDIKSDLFLKIVDTCSFIILPSCSEGCATSVLTGMLHGLIPVVMKDAGFNRLGQYAIFLEDYKIDNIDPKLTELSTEAPEALNSFSKKIFDFAAKNFINSSFETNFRTIVRDLLNKND